jgi:hypothetical protein
MQPQELSCRPVYLIIVLLLACRLVGISEGPAAAQHPLFDGQAVSMTSKQFITRLYSHHVG